MRVLLIASLLLAQAPIQCSREPPHDLRREETPPEALYDLAGRFRAKGDLTAWRDTLSYLVERYPSSRFAERAKQDLTSASGAGANGGAGNGEP